jgi:hypothetical protein
MAKQAPSGTKRPGSARAKGPTPRGTSPKAAAHAGGAAPAPRTSGRFTPKAIKATKPPAPPPVSSGRYTPPIPANKRSSPPWVPVLMLGLLLGGALVIVLDYLGVLPYGTSSWYLLVGLVLVALGFGVATQYR